MDGLAFIENGNHFKPSMAYFTSKSNKYKMKTYFLLAGLILVSFGALAQTRQNPIIKNHGGIYDIEEATVKVDAEMPYKIVIDVYTGSTEPTEVNPSINNVARLINLHAISGADMANFEVVLAIHGTSAFSIMDEANYKKKYGVSNPNIGIIDELAEAGVVLTVCGQSLRARNIPTSGVNPKVQIATSMLTTVTTYQLKGYAYMKF